MKSIFAALLLTFPLFAHAEYMGVFRAPGLPEVAVYKEHDKLILSARDGSTTEVYRILEHLSRDGYNFGDRGRQSDIDGTVIEVLGQSGAYDGLLKTTYSGRQAVSSVLYLLRDYCGR